VKSLFCALNLEYDNDNDNDDDDDKNNVEQGSCDLYLNNMHDEDMKKKLAQASRQTKLKIKVYVAIENHWTLLLLLVFYSHIRTVPR
jgi:hypothetical protein